MSCNINGNILGEFRSINVNIDEKNKSFSYLFNGYIHEKGATPDIGLGFLRFTPTSGRKYQLGSGHFRAKDSDYVYYQTIRISQELKKSAIDNTNIKTHEDIKKIILKYLEEKT